MGAGVCLAAGGQDEAGAGGSGPGPPPRPHRQLQGLILAQLAPLLMACVLLSTKANQLRMAAKEDSETAGPLLYKLTLQLKASQARPDVTRSLGEDLIKTWWGGSRGGGDIGKPHLERPPPSTSSAHGLEMTEHVGNQCLKM